MKSVELRELPLTEVQRAECYRHGERIVLLLNGKAYVLTADAATELAFRLCAEAEETGRG